MSGQRRAFAPAAMVAVVALLSVAVSGCSAQSGEAPESLCDLSITGTLERPVDGGYVYTYANGTTARIAFANGSCVLDVNPFPIAHEQGRSAWELGFTYDYYLAQLGPCLNGFGYPSVAPPERADFIESDGDWSPYDAVFTAMVSGSTIAQLNSVCPRHPPALR
jgi:hypothetical protein